MNYPRVNLLKKSEQRYQGVVSRSFILLCGIGAPVLIVALIIGVCQVNSMSVKAQMASTQDVWEMYEPRLNEFRKERLGLATGGKVLDLFEGWKESQVSMVEVLNDVQGVVPESVQFSRLSIRSESSKPLYKTPEELRMNYTLSIDGIAFGAEAEKQVINMQRDLREGPQLGELFNSVKLASIRNRQVQGGTPARDFRLVAAAEKGEK